MKSTVSGFGPSAFRLIHQPCFWPDAPRPSSRTPLKTQSARDHWWFRTPSEFSFSSSLSRLRRGFAICDRHLYLPQHCHDLLCRVPALPPPRVPPVPALTNSSAGTKFPGYSKVLSLEVACDFSRGRATSRSLVRNASSAPPTSTAFALRHPRTRFSVATRLRIIE
jgi:hypothetical protein